MRAYFDDHAPHTWAAPQTEPQRTADGKATGNVRRWFNRYDATTRQRIDQLPITQKNPTSGAWWITDTDGAISVWAEGEWRIIGYQVGTELPASTANTEEP